MKKLDFVALDFETANSNYASICQIGIVIFRDGKIDEKVCQLIDPESFFEGINMARHGIKENEVKGKPTFSQFSETLNSYLQDQIVVHYQPFDYSAYHQACELHGLEPVDCIWLDVAKVVRRLWFGFQHSGYGLENVSAQLGINYKPHDACEDAGAAGQVFIEACNQSGRTIKDWTRRINWKINKRKLIKIQPAGTIIEKKGKASAPVVEDTENPFYGKRVVVSGDFDNWPWRDELVEILIKKGARVTQAVSGSTNILCIGKSAGPVKIEKMEDNIEQGKDAKIITERQLLKLLKKK